MTEAKLSLQDLRIAFGPRTVVDLDRLELGAGEILGLAGESGSGKSITALAVLGLASTLGARVEGSVRLDGEELVGAPESRLREIRGSRISMIFQSPVSSLDPLLQVGELFERTLRLHGVGKREASERASNAFREVLLSPDLLRRYPHELSGGQAQRIAIAMALALRSEVLLADEPTSALDVTVQAEILDLLRRVREERGMSVLFISHDLAVIAELCDRVAVMQLGGSSRRARPRACSASRRTTTRSGSWRRSPRSARRHEAPVTAVEAPLLEVEDLVVEFGPVRAVDGVSFRLPAGPYGLALVGESGSGKTTIARALMRLVSATSGAIRLDGSEVVGSSRALRAYRRDVQIVFQDPTTSLDPRAKIGSTIAEPLRAHGIVPRSEVDDRIASLLAEVGLDPEMAGRYPHQLSGGQRQRVAIARALSVEPRVLVLDEPTSALDVTVQARILELIAKLRRERGLAYVLISHNLAVVEQLCEETAVLYLGRIVEHGPTEQILARPAHPYTLALRSAVPEIDLAARRSRIVLPGAVPDPANPPPGCPFHPRCPYAIDRCRTEVPELRTVEGRSVACHRAEEILGGQV